MSDADIRKLLKTRIYTPCHQTKHLLSWTKTQTVKCKLQQQNLKFVLHGGDISARLEDGHKMQCSLLDKK